MESETGGRGWERGKETKEGGGRLRRVPDLGRRANHGDAVACCVGPHQMRLLQCVAVAV